MNEAKTPHGLSGLSLLTTIKFFLESTAVGNRAAALKVILTWVEQMEQLTTLSETNLLSIVRPWTLLCAAEKQFAISARYLLPISNRANYEPSLARALETALESLRVYALAELLSRGIADEDRSYFAQLDIRPYPSTNDGLVILGVLIGIKYFYFIVYIFYTIYKNILLFII